MIKRPSLSQDELELMEANLYAIQRQITERTDEHEPLSSSHLRQSPPNHYSPEPPKAKPTLVQRIRQRYQDYLKQRQLPENHQQKISFLLEEAASPGNSVALFEMLHYFKEALAEETLEEIAEKAFQALIRTEDEEEMRCYGELLGQCGVQTEEVCQHVAELIVQEKIAFELGFAILSNQGETGLVYLFDLASRDLPLSHRIIDSLTRTQTIICQLLVPLLLQDLLSQTHPKFKDIALSILNRLGPAISDPNVVEQLGRLLCDPAIDKRILMATFRSLGTAGQQFLLQLISSRRYSESIVSLALSVLSWRVPVRPVLRMKAIAFTLDNCFLPGRLYQYQGQVESWTFQNQSCSDSLCVSTRDFLAQLQIFLKEGAFRNQPASNNKSLFTLIQVLELQQEENVQISQQVVRVLAHQLKNKSLKVREVALLQLGNIGHPEGTVASEAVIRCLWDSDSNIRSAACWTASRICPEPNRKLQGRLAELLKDHFWKVRTSACIALGLVVKRPQHTTVEQLLKALQDGSIPKPTVCEALARIGAEELLLEMLKGSSKADFKLREAIIGSFEFSSLRSPLVNLIVEELLRHSRDPRLETREMCLLGLHSLRNRVQARGGETISYFQTKNLLPFYYCFLDDASPRIRAVAAEGILSFGAQAELIFIEGMTKGQPLAKVECIKCLGRLGVQNFRALVLGLRDQDQRVKRAATNTILASFSIEEVVEQFKERQNHSISLTCNLNQILKTSIPNQDLKSFLRKLITALNDQRKHGTIRHCNENIRVNS